jgi:hypothetical protein
MTSFHVVCRLNLNYLSVRGQYLFVLDPVLLFTYCFRFHILSGFYVLYAPGPYFMYRLSRADFINTLVFTIDPSCYLFLTFIFSFFVDFISILSHNWARNWQIFVWTYSRNNALIK